ncbi:MAG: InlB B-repeat-containing protein [Clostridiales Family XIII bacterium]|jgi:hypothetical protein|nr:InlB B-repeat-containing protein [Clostridiales Family XIII bacterium]
MSGGGVLSEQVAEGQMSGSDNPDEAVLPDSRAFSTNGDKGWIAGQARNDSETDNSSVIPAPNSVIPASEPESISSNEDWIHCDSPDGASQHRSGQAHARSAHYDKEGERAFSTAITSLQKSTNLIEALVNEDSVYTVTFKNGDGSTYKTYYVENGETVHEPKIPELPPGKTSFFGWYIDGTDTTDPNEAFQIENTPITDALVTDNNLTLTAVYSDKYLVQFEDASGLIIHSETASAGDTITNPNLKFTAPSGMVTTGKWFPKGNSVTQFYFGSSGTQINDNLILAPELVFEHNVYFHTNGSYIRPEKIIYNGVTDLGDVTKPTSDPSRSGYSFLYWSSDDPDKVSSTIDYFQSSNPVQVAESAGDVHLYAVWEAIDVGYTIVYWNEKANIDGNPGANTQNYQYIYSKVVDKDDIGEALTAGTVLDDTTVEGIATRYYALAKGANSELTYSNYGFTTAVGKTIAGNDSTIINVYYQRIVYTFDFQYPAGMTFVYKGQSYATGTYSFEAKFGQVVSGMFPEPQDVTNTSNQKFYGWLYGNETDENSGPHQTHFNPYSIGFASINPTSAGSTTIIVKPALKTFDPAYLHERLAYIELTVEEEQYVDDNSIEIANMSDETASMVDGTHREYLKYNGKIYKYSPSYVVSNYTYNGANITNIAQLVYDGLSPTPGNFASGGWVQPAEFIRGSQYSYTYGFYNRREVTIELDAGSGTNVQSSISGPFEEPIGNLSAYNPTPPDGYDFVDWYWDNDYKTRFTGDELYPALDAKLYAKYEPNAYYVYFKAKAADSEPKLTVGVAANGKVIFPEDIYQIGEQVEGYGTFLGWYWTKDGKTQEYAWENEIIENVELVAMWQTDGFGVSYDIGTGTSGSIPVDGSSYDISTKVNVLDGSGLKDGSKVFAGWTYTYTDAESVSHTDIVYPGMHINVYGNTTLVARYVDPDDLVKLTYHRNTDKGDSKLNDLKVQRLAPYSIASESDLGYSRAHYKFIGWSSDKDAKEADAKYDAGNSVRFSAANSNLYAVWKPINYTVKYLPGIHGTFAEQITGGLHYSDGVAPNTPAAPEASGEAGWQFDGWDKTIASKVTENVTYTAVWKPIAYTVKYLPGAHGSFVEQITGGLHYSDLTPAAPEASGEAGWQFDGWDKTIASKVTGNATYTAVWKPIDYTVKYLPGTHGSFAEQVTGGLHYSDLTPSAPEASGEAGWQFDGWDKTVAAKVTGDATYTALWSRIPVGVDEEEEIDEPQEPETNAPTGTTTERGGAPIDRTDRNAEMFANQTGNPIIDVLNGNVPLGGFGTKGAWSLLSLLISLVATIISVLLVAGTLVKRRREDDLYDGYIDDEAQNKRGKVLKALTVIFGILTPIVWLILDNLNQPMVWINNWTFFVGIVFIAQIALLVVYKLRRADRDSEHEEAYVA